MDQPAPAPVQQQGVAAHVVPAVPVPAPVAAPAPQRVVIAGAEIPFWDLVWLMVKWAFAAIPAVIIIAAVVGLVFLAVATLGPAATLLTRRVQAYNAEVVTDSPDQIYREYRQNRVIADNKYLYRKIRVVGEAYIIAEDGSSILMSLKNPSVMGAVQLGMNRDYSSQALLLRGGDFINADCQGAGFSDGKIKFSDCKIVK